ncbi:MAG: hypothetical protein IAE79_20240 [Anaerolinea sp.]|nr:hypothetical protein [Anaerolinea sp.]
MMGKILIYDDLSSRLQQWKDSLDVVKPDEWDVDALPDEVFRDHLKILFERRKQSRNDSIVNKVSVFDSADIVFIDYDLIEADGNLNLTGEDVAYLLRCYSKCGYIVAINQFRTDRTFDLTMNGHLDKFADLHISEADIASEGLWKQEWKGFRPSTWPYLPDAPSLYNARVDDIKNSLGIPIIEFFEFPDSAVISDSLANFLDVPEKEFSEVTFTDFVKKSTNALKPKDAQPDEEMMARIAAARIHKWLEHGILPLQNILVDAPHIALRLPSLYIGETESADSWNQLNIPNEELPLNIEVIKKHQFSHESWLSRPVWFWRDVQNNRDIQEVKEPWKFEPPPFVFCEDTSHFVQEEEATEFDTGRPSSYSLRHIEKLEEIAYIPLRQLFT